MIDLQGAELTAVKRSHSNISNSNKELRTANQSLQYERDGLNRNLEDATQLSNVRGNELAGSQVFLSRADTVSVAELQDRINALNEEIFQAAASLGDFMVPRRYELSDNDGRLFRDRLQKFVGKRMLYILGDQARSNRPEVNSLLIQVAIQIFLVEACEYEMVNLDPNEVEFSRNLTKLYRGIQESGELCFSIPDGSVLLIPDFWLCTEQQSVSGRWRALTLAQIKPNFDKWEKDVVKNIQRLFQVACWDVSHPEHLIAFRRRLEAIFKVAQEIRLAIGQHIISEEFRVHIVRSDESFDSAYMEEEYGDERERGVPDRKTSCVVIGTTAMGLGRVVFSQDNHSRDLECVFPPKVVTDKGLIATLAASSRSPSPRKRAEPWYQDGQDRVHR